MRSFAYPPSDGTNAAYHFRIELPMGDRKLSYFYLENVTEYPGECEVVFPPYTRFLTLEDPVTDASGIIHIPIRATRQLLTPDCSFKEHVIWCDENVFRTENLALASELWRARLPGVEVQYEASGNEIWMEWCCASPEPGSISLF